MKIEIITTPNEACKSVLEAIIIKENKIPKNITTVYKHKTQNSNKLDLYIDIDKVGFIDYKIKKEFNTIALLSIGKSLNMFYEKNNFEEDLFKTKQGNNTNYLWSQ
jgi:hypothetical protein